LLRKAPVTTSVGVVQKKSCQEVTGAPSVGACLRKGLRVKPSVKKI